MGLKLLNSVQKRISLAFVAALLAWSASMMLMVAAGMDPWLAHDLSLVMMFGTFALFAWKPLKEAEVFKKIGELIED